MIKWKVLCMLVCKGTFFVLFSKKNLCNCKKNSNFAG